jgi:TRAP-type C4-dicarboxylate transport system substrate-binding protein
MKHSEQFAINQWLSDYPENMTYAEIMDLMNADDEDGLISVWQTIEGYPLTEVAEFIDNTRSQFENTIHAMKAEGELK